MSNTRIQKKLGVLFEIIKTEGLLAGFIIFLQFIQRYIGKNRKRLRRHKINTGAVYDEILLADPKYPANKDWLGKDTKGGLTLNWLMPPPGKGSGGHMTLFRFIKYCEDAGHTCRLYFHKPGPTSNIHQVKHAMGDAFPELNASMEWLWPGEEMEAADALFATSWETAYTIYSSKLKAKKFYFVQDFEPFFYPVGGFSVLAENTYRLGLRGITAGGWLAKKLHNDYGMITNSFDFGADHKVYQYKATPAPRKDIVFYARPTTERRAFELGVLTLDLFHQKHPEYTINFIGWDVSEFDIPFPYKNLGILDPPELNTLYNKCAASLVMSLTNMSLLPLELLSSGCVPIVTDGENNRLVSDNKYIEYSQANPVELADALSRVISRTDLEEYSKKASESVKTADWDEAGAHVVSVIERAIVAPGDK